MALDLFVRVRLAARSRGDVVSGATGEGAGEGVAVFEMRGQDGGGGGALMEKI